MKRVLASLMTVMLVWGSIGKDHFFVGPIYQEPEPIILKLRPSIYHPVTWQTDSTPHITASGKRIDLSDPGKHRYVALSRDQIRPWKPSHTKFGYNPDALFEFGDTIVVKGTGSLDGIWIIADSMNKRFKSRIDFLVDYDVTGYDFPDSVIVQL